MLRNLLLVSSLLLGSAALSTAHGALVIYDSASDKHRILSMHKRSPWQVLEPMKNEITTCVVNAVVSNPDFQKKGSDLNTLIVATAPICRPQVRAFIGAYNFYFGPGSGEYFFMSNYLYWLPDTVSKLLPH